MVEKKITRRIISKKVATEEKVVLPVAAEEQPVVEKTEEAKTKKVCAFCKSKTVPSYTDTNSLRRYISDRAKIQPRTRSGLCAKHQRVITHEIKYARHLGLLPFTPKV
jgi:small subunit ribosomal protein S18